MRASDSMKIFQIVKLIIGAGGLPVAVVAFVFRKGFWDARFIPHTRASILPESVHIQGMVVAAALAIFYLLLIIHSVFRLRSYKQNGR